MCFTQRIKCESSTISLHKDLISIIIIAKLKSRGLLLDIMRLKDRVIETKE
ncbi:hypothetical protein C1H46_045930 [Malus baccata]|uniref:Uncharacterized protein n=1 Tax=Malus baccata TaxID=106549 RepID=A0A540K2M0_MALBA|nr:hypothetical protein C1H46_045930 [Malus baccata]